MRQVAWSLTQISFAWAWPTGRHPARLLVGADGRDSWVRRNAGLTATDTQYGEKGVVANLATEKPHRNVARQWFSDAGVLAYLPLPGNRIPIVWSTRMTMPMNSALCLEDVFCDRVADAGGQVLGRLELITRPAAFPLRLIRVPQILRRAWRWLAMRRTVYIRFPVMASISAFRMPVNWRFCLPALNHGRILATSAFCSATSAPGARKRH